MESRLSWDEYFAEIANVTSKRSCDKRLKVGTVLVKDNRIVSTGYNGNCSGVPNDQTMMVDGHDVLKVHSEVNAICNAAKFGVNISGSVCYVTHFPCINCAKSLIASGISKIHYINSYKDSQAVTDLCQITNTPLIKLNALSVSPSVKTEF